MNEPNISLRAEIVGESDEVQRLKSELAAVKARLSQAREALDWIVTGTMIDTTPLGATDVTMSRVIDRCNQFARETLEKLDAPAADTGGKESV